jgi:hypothetical protein
MPDEAALCVKCGVATTATGAVRLDVPAWGGPGLVGLCILSFFIPIVGAFVWGFNKKYPSRTEQANIVGACAVVGAVINLALMFG